TYAPYVFQGIHEASDRPVRDSAVVAPAAGAAPTLGRAGATLTGGDSTVAKARPGPWAFIAALAALAGFLLAVPVIAGFDSPIGLVITGIAIYEAWKINRGASLRITGPYQVGAPA